MPNATDRYADPDKQPGFTPGKRVWFARDFEAEVVRKRSGLAHAAKITGKERTTAAGMSVEVTDDAGLVLVVATRHLRLSAPKGLSATREKPKDAKPPKRKEAIKPEYGDELTIFDHLAEA